MRCFKGPGLFQIISIILWNHVNKIDSFTCLIGSDAPTPRDVTRVKTCGPHEACFLDAYVTPAGLLRYQMGCRDKLQCGASTIAGQKYVVCTKCCEDDICQPTLCGNPGYPKDIGPICYNCDFPVDGPTKCDTIKECSRDDVCGVNKTATGRYDVKCTPKDICANNKLTGSCTSCCNSTLCNDNCEDKCKDSPTCSSLYDSFQLSGQDICQNPIKVMCNATCGLCNAVISPMTSSQTTSSSTVMLPTKPLSTTVTTTQMMSTNGDPCTTGPCVHGQCFSSQATYVCMCSSGYTGINCDQAPTTAPPTRTTTKPTTQANPCMLSPCVNGQCFSSLNKYFCQCSTGYTGVNCDQDMDDCITSPCAINGTCFDQLNGYQCQCSPGFTGNHCQTNIDDCINSPCGNRGTCVDQVNGYRCDCSTGYAGDHCQIAPTTAQPTRTTTKPTTQANPCSSRPCVNGQCFSSLNKYFCQCSTGYTGVNCDQDINDCVNSPCGNHGTCVDQLNGYRCDCSTGYAGDRCQTVQPTLKPSDQTAQICSVIWSYLKLCLTCKDINYCTNSPCGNYGTCVDQVSGYRCDCSPGYSGNKCQININDCANSPCGNHGTCVDQVAGYRCDCSPGYSGNQCQININDCINSPCGNHGNCVDQVNGYRCDCSTGYAGDQCQIAPTTASPIATTPTGATISPCTCLYGSCIEAAPGAYLCTCDAGYSGSHCNKALRDCNDVENENIPRTVDNVYHIRVGGADSTVVCDRDGDGDGNGWTRILNRQNGDTFDKDSTNYALGFGLTGDNWIGLANLHTMTTDGRRYQLKVKLWDKSGSVYIQYYDDFSIGNYHPFALHVGHTHGTAGDGLSAQNQASFVTKEQSDQSYQDCSATRQGGWWFSGCAGTCLTCKMVSPSSMSPDAMMWDSPVFGQHSPLTRAQMFFMPM